MRTFAYKIVVGLVLSVVLSSGCYSTRMMDFTYTQLDTVKTAQQALLERIDVLTQQVEKEREARVRAQAENSVTLQELHDLIEMLAYRLDDTSQLISRTQHPTQRQPTAESRPSRQDPDSTALDSSKASGVPTDSIAPPLEGDSEAERLFKGSYMDLTLGSYDLAVQGFKNYIVRYASSARMPAAMYYLGESYFALGRYLEAVAEYQSVVREYPKSRFVPAAYLKSGYCYEKLEMTQFSERAFRELISLFPRSEEAAQARVSLKAAGG